MGRHMRGRVNEHKTLTGNLIQIMVAGKVVGRIQSISSRESFGTEPVYELGSMMPAEYVTNRWQGTLTIEKYQLRRSQFDGLPVAYSENVLTSELFDVVVIDKATGVQLEKFIGCIQSDAGKTFQANRAANQNVTFFYMDHDDGQDAGGQD